jgi:hypothetical protein
MEDIFCDDIVGEIESYLVDRRTCKSNVLKFWLDYVYRQLENTDPEYNDYCNCTVIIVCIRNTSIVSDIYKILVDRGFRTVFINNQGDLQFIFDPEFDPYWINKAVKKILTRADLESRKGNLGYNEEIPNDYRGDLIRQRLISDFNFKVSQICYRVLQRRYIDIKWI